MSTNIVISCNKIVLSRTLLHGRLSHPHCDVVKHMASFMNKELGKTSSDDLGNLCQTGVS